MVYYEFELNKPLKYNLTGKFQAASSEWMHFARYMQDYVKWNRNKDIKVSEIADYFGYNTKYISRLFKSIAGITLKQYFLQEKIEEAKYLLCDTNANISEIAYQSGFQDSHNFMKMFKKIVGLTPTQYRDAYALRVLFYK